MFKKAPSGAFFVFSVYYFDMAGVWCLSSLSAAISKVALLSQAQRSFAGLNSLAFASANEVAFWCPMPLFFSKERVSLCLFVNQALSVINSSEIGLYNS
ncbi:hypothetical protein [Amphritea sp.]|uniref:hypothetical protein n=1 Tax=Amphritea sp. TaxID=1872502 RepID=UPI0025B8DB42|nr:hypothetical protein [Amphritea sp.]